MIICKTKNNNIISNYRFIYSKEYNEKLDDLAYYENRNKNCM
jgi:hypothetical protein